MTKSTQVNKFRLALLVTVPSLMLSQPGWSRDIVIADGEIVEDSLDLEGDDSLTIAEGGVLSVDGSAIKLESASTGIVIDNRGTIESVEPDGRAIAARRGPTGPRTLTLNNSATGIIQAESDAFRINNDITSGIVTINNAGLIRSTVDGQALDFNSIESAGTDAAQVTINNLAGGVIRAEGADGIRPGQGAIINNAGLIFAGGVVGDKHDGIDWQERSGTVVNLDGGVITGFRHGIETDIFVDVFNAAGGVIIGRNGSGVGSDGDGRVVNYGRITGSYAGEGPGDGDGVDIDFHGEVENFGIIEGTGASRLNADGEPNGSEGVAITESGYVINHENASITGQSRGVTAFGDIRVENYGLIRGNDVGLIMSRGATGINGGQIFGRRAVMLQGVADFTNLEGGLISGVRESVLSQLGNRVVNRGAMTGNVVFRAMSNGVNGGSSGNVTTFIQDGGTVEG
ncbi:MAG: hypothetical protein WA908_12470, partial [Pontixanthobacter sp.]